MSSAAQSSAAGDGEPQVALSTEQVAPMQGFTSFDSVDRKSTRFAVFPGAGEAPKAPVGSRASFSRAPVSRASKRASTWHLGAALHGVLQYGAGPSPDGFGNHLASCSASLPAQ